MRLLVGVSGSYYDFNFVLFWVFFWTCRLVQKIGLLGKFRTFPVFEELGGLV